MADRINQPEAAKMKPENKSYYDLFGDVNPAVEAAKKKYEEPEVKEEKVSSTWKDRNLTDIFVEKYGNNLVGSKLSNAINEFSKDMGIQGAWKEDLAQSYIGIRKSSLTPEQVKSQFSEDVKTKKLDAVDYAPFLKEGYKKLESYGIKVPNAPQKTEKKKTTTTKSESPEVYQTEEAKAFQKKWESKGVKFNVNGEAINPPQEMIDDYNKTFKTEKIWEKIQQVDVDSIINPIIKDIVWFKWVNLTQEQLKKARDDANKVIQDKKISNDKKKAIIRKLLENSFRPTNLNPLNAIQFVSDIKEINSK